MIIQSTAQLHGHQLTVLRISRILFHAKGLSKEKKTIWNKTILFRNHFSFYKRKTISLN